MNKEQVYDEAIAPLIAEILETCHAHGIAMFATFALPTDEDPELHCTSALPDGDGISPDAIERARRALFQRPSFAAFTTTKALPEAERRSPL